MKYLLDTNTCIRFINGRVPKLRQKFLAVSDDDIVVSAIAKADMYYGTAKSQHPERSRSKQMEIAAIAMAHGLIVVTHNTREFQRIAGLKIEDWEV